MERGLEELEGVVERVVFENAEGSFSVFRLRAVSRALATVTLAAPAPLVGEQLSLAGAWTSHARFGDQFKAQTVRRAAPTSAAGIERFLASGAVSGVGASMARKLVAKFGLKTLEIIEKHPARLREVEGVGPKKAEAIHRGYSAQSELREIMLLLETHGVSGAFAAKIFARYGSFAADVIRDDPYRLAREIDGVGFRTADQIAASMGMERASAKRVAAGIDFALLQIAGAGHCCAPESALIEQTAKLISVERVQVAAELTKLLKADRLLSESWGGGALIYPPHLYYAERSVARRLLYLKDKAKQADAAGVALEVEDWEKDAKIKLAERQRAAVESALTHGVFALTGGPGTGKTTVVRGMIAALEKRGFRILLGAPTGRAAKRLSEATGRRAVTVHRLLESSGSAEGRPMFGRGADEPLEADVVILDEVSMMDILLMHYFLEAVPKGCRVILVGDVDQLPAVGPGSVLKDILRSECIPTVRLTEVFRSAVGGMIVLNAHAINGGFLPDCREGGDFQFREIADSGQVCRAIVELCAAELPAAGFDAKRQVQVLAPMHRLDCGVENLNKLLQDALNPGEEHKPAVMSGTQVFRLGDKVMQTRNNYMKNVFNGDIGFIVRVADGKIGVQFPDAEAEYEKNELSELQLAYAMSVHKSQGSEYPVVVMPLVPGHRVMLQRNLLYTAVTRAKRRVILVGAKAALHTAVANDRTKKRYSLLAERLRMEILE